MAEVRTEALSLDARNAFASTRPPERKHIVEGVFGGPLGGGDLAYSCGLKKDNVGVSNNVPQGGSVWVFAVK